MTTLREERIKFMIRNGEMLAERCSDTPFVFQYIHTFNHKTRYMAEHIALLNSSAEELFGERLKANCSIHQLDHQIEELLATNRLTRNASICVELRLDAVGNYELRSHEPSIYSGYVHRSLRPDAVCLPINIPMQQHPTSAAAATRLLADAMARKNGFHRALIAERDGGLAIEPCEPLFLIKEYTLTAQQGCNSVEDRLTTSAAEALGLKIERRRVMVGDLKDADEVFSVNWQGVSSMAHIGKQPYMSIMAEKIASQMERAANIKR